MQVGFRQGIVKIPKDGNGVQLFAIKNNDNTITLSTTNGKSIFHFADRDANYLHTEHNTTISAWGPFTGSSDVWLFLEIDKHTGLRIFGHTQYAPILSATTPTSNIAVDQMWFNTSTNQMQVFNGSGWVVKIRLVVLKLESGSIIKPWNGGTTYEGSQIGSMVKNNAGAIVFDETDRPIKRSNKSFFTSTDQITVGVDVVSSISLESMSFDAKAVENMAANTVVVLNKFDEIGPAKNTNIGESVYGMILHDVIVGERANFVTNGIVTNPNWNWPTANALVYYDTSGQVTTTMRVGLPPIGVVVEPTRILLRPSNTGGGSGSNSTSNQSVQAYPNAIGQVIIDTNIHWHTIEQSGILNLDFNVPTGNSVDRFNIEIISNGDVINWPGTMGGVMFESGTTRVFNVTHRPETQGIEAKFIITEYNLI